MKVADETENKPDFGQMVDQIEKGNKHILQYSRLRFLATWLAVACLAIMTCAALVSASRNAQTDIEQTDDIARVANTTAESAEQDTDDIVAYMRGEQGIPGVPGSNGTDGSPGLPGGSGEPGPEGPKGDKGDTGPAGTSGTPGSMGASGSAGPIGPNGPQGPFGDIGPVGPTGEAGPKGEKGDKGDEGARGNEGPSGPVGAQGPAGPAGASAPPFQITTTIAIGQSANDTTAHKTANATCASGRASGGGFAIVPSDPGIIPTASSPVGTNGWSATADVLSLPPGTNWQLLVFVTCVS